MAGPKHAERAPDGDRIAETYLTAVSGVGRTDTARLTSEKCLRSIAGGTGRDGLVGPVPARGGLRQASQGQDPLQLESAALARCHVRGQALGVGGLELAIRELVDQVAGGPQSSLRD
jgi:hypothetical protein